VRRTVMIAGGILLGLAAIALFVSRSGRAFASISPEEARARLARDSTIVLLDVRSEKEYRSETGHLAGAICIPEDSLGNRIGELSAFRGQPLIVYCKTGRRSTRASEFLAQQGFEPVNLEGGIQRWADRGYPVVIEKDKEN